jgi:hypothetical protein
MAALIASCGAEEGDTPLYAAPELSYNPLLSDVEFYLVAVEDGGVRIAFNNNAPYLLRDFAPTEWEWFCGEAWWIIPLRNHRVLTIIETQPWYSGTELHIPILQDWDFVPGELYRIRRSIIAPDLPLPVHDLVVEFIWPYPD